MRLSYQSKGRFDRLCVITSLSSQEIVCDWGLVEEGERRGGEGMRGRGGEVRGFQRISKDLRVFERIREGLKGF